MYSVLNVALQIGSKKIGKPYLWLGTQYSTNALLCPQGSCENYKFT